MIGMAIASLVVAAGSAYMANKAQKSAAREQRKAQATSLAENAANRSEQTRDQIRQGRVRTAQIIQASANTGTTGSSGELGSTSSIGSLVGSNVATLSRSGNTALGINNNMNQASQDQSTAATWGAIGSFATTSFSVFSSMVGGGKK